MLITKRRQTLLLQLLAVIAGFCTIAYVFFPSTRPGSLQLSDNWYDESDLTGFEPHQNQEMAALAAVHHGGKQEPLIDPNRVKAAFVILARNSNLQGIRQSIRQMEDRFNKKFNYPYVFLNDDYFTEEFKKKTSDLTNAQTFYGKIDEDMWGYPDHINETYAAECRKDYENRGIIYGGSESYRHMCRFQSGFFFRHPLLDNFEYYWRVEPDVQYFCDVDYDVFQMMKDNKYKYGWTLSLTEYMATIPTLWSATQSYMDKYPQYINWDDDSLMPLITDNDFESYNGCHFWSNFEIGSLDFLRSEPYMKYFEHLDKLGGFFYERWGDAPVHSIAVAMLLKTSEVHFFNDIGYKHNPLTHCPTEPYLQKNCWCDEKENFDWQGWSCATRYKKIQKDFIWNESVYNNKTDPYRIQT